MGNVSGDSAETTITVDTTAPRVTTPTGAGVARNTLVTATFSEGMDVSSVERPGTVKLGLVDGKGRTAPVAADVSYDQNAKKVTLKPTTGLARGSTYRATIRTTAKDEAGNALVRPRTWHFTVARR